MARVEPELALEHVSGSAVPRKVGAPLTTHCEGWPLERIDESFACQGVAVERDTTPRRLVDEIAQ
jgi:hypothetical protein